MFGKESSFLMIKSHLTKISDQLTVKPVKRLSPWGSSPKSVLVYKVHSLRSLQTKQVAKPFTLTQIRTADTGQQTKNSQYTHSPLLSTFTNLFFLFGKKQFVFLTHMLTKELINTVQFLHTCITPMVSYNNDLLQIKCLD